MNQPALVVVALALAAGCPISPTDRTTSCGACDESAESGATRGEPLPPDCPTAETCAACDDFVRYPNDRTHSPLPCSTAERLRRVTRVPNGLSEGRFMKVGDSISATHEFLFCFETEALDLDETGHGALEDVRAHFRASRVEGTTSFDRKSVATRVGETARWALLNEPSAVASELDVTRARYSLVMFGTNDIQYGGPDASPDVKLPFMTRHMRDLVDWHLENGVVPVLYSIPPYNGRTPAIRWLVPTHNAILRALAEHRQIPFVDYYREMVKLPNEGLRESDGVHPSADYLRLCNFDDDGLKLGYNLRNLLTLEALDRVWRVTRERSQERELDRAGAPALEGQGTVGAPFVVDALPFGDMREPSFGGVSAALPRACPLGPPPRQTRYRLDLDDDTPIRAVAVGFAGARVRLTVDDRDPNPACPGEVAVIQRTLPAGARHLAVDVVRPDGGEAVVVIVRCHDDDTRCR